MKKKYALVLSLFFLLSVFLLPVQGKDKKVMALGKYDFHHYYTYGELTDFLKDVHQAYPHLTELTAMSRSSMGRDVWMLTINNPDSGKAGDKPGIFLNQIHSSEVIASMSCCYTIWYLLDNYGKKSDVTSIVDSMVWYIVPRLDVDGAEAYLTGKPAGEDPHPVDNDGDGKFDEDPAEDINGDGHIVQMRRKENNGVMKISARDPRLMIRRGPDEKGGTYYRIYPEGIDNDGDGKINEDGFRTRFLSNRNYPGNWRPKSIQGGAGRYPLEEGITRAEVDFVAAHPNIAIYVQHHCCGRVILRPPTTTTDKDFKNRGDLEKYRVVSARSLEHSGWDLATSVYEWNWPRGVPNRKSSQIFRDKDGRIRNAPSGMYPEKDESETGFDFSGWIDDYEGDHGYFAWGSSLDTMYDLFGIFSMGDEHWASPDYDGDGNITEKERLKWNDEELKEELYINWRPFNHPTLGQVEIGGWRRHKVSPPEGGLIQRECVMGNNFVIYLAGQAARIRIGETSIKNKEGGIFQVDITVENIGFLSTSTDQADALNLVEPVLLGVEPGENLEIIFGEKLVKLGQIKGNSSSEKTTYIVRVKDDSLKAILKVRVTSQRAGRDEKEVLIK